MDHDKAVDYAWTHGVATGVISAATSFIPGGKTVLGQILFQTFVGQPLGGAAVRTGVPLVTGEPLPSPGEYIEGYGQDVMTAGGLLGGHAASRNTYRRIMPPDTTIPDLPPAVIDEMARERLTPAELPSRTDRVLHACPRDTRRQVLSPGLISPGPTSPWGLMSPRPSVANRISSLLKHPPLKVRHQGKRSLHPIWRQRRGAQLM